MSGPTPPLQGEFETFAEAHDAAGNQHGDRDAYVDGTDRLSYAAWVRASDALASVLVERGVRPGDVVALHLPSTIDYAVAYAAVLRAGGVVTGINARLGPREKRAIVDRSAPALVISDVVPGPEAPWLDDVPVVHRSDLVAAMEGPALGAERPTRSASDPAVIIWTSGTTGVPKGAWFDHRNLEAAVRSAGIMSRPYDRKLVGTPFPHAGYMAKVWDQVAWGTTIVVSPTPWSVDDMLRIVVDEQITVVGGVPTQWEKLIAHPRIDDADLSHVRLCLVATAPAAPELIERVTGRFRCPMIVRYAMTESPSITGTEPGDEPETLYRTVGRPQAGMEVALVDDEGTEVEPGAVGRVRVRGACVMRGYWRDPALTAEVISDAGWLTSSDLGRFDDDGNLVLVGRANDLYIRGGYNVYPLEVEHALAEHPAVDRVAVVGCPAPVIGEIGVAYVVPTDQGDPPTTDELRAWTAERLADYKAPDRVEIVDDLPLTAMLKIDKTELGRRAQAEQEDIRR